jgi:predicted nucleotidyltransferase
MKVDRLTIFECHKVQIEIDHENNCVSFVLYGADKWREMTVVAYGGNQVPEFLDTVTITKQTAETE